MVGEQNGPCSVKHQSLTKNNLLSALQVFFYFSLNWYYFIVNILVIIQLLNIFHNGCGEQTNQCLIRGFCIAFCILLMTICVSIIRPLKKLVWLA